VFAFVDPRFLDYGCFVCCDIFLYATLYETIVHRIGKNFFRMFFALHIWKISSKIWYCCWLAGHLWRFLIRIQPEVTFCFGDRVSKVQGTKRLANFTINLILNYISFNYCFILKFEPARIGFSRVVFIRHMNITTNLISSLHDVRTLALRCT